MSLLSKIPVDQLEEFPFLSRVNFEKLSMQLAGRALTQRAAPQVEEDASTKPRSYFHHLVGMQPKLEKLETVLSSSQSRNAWIEGPDGIGKTVLVEALLRARAEKRLTSNLMSKPYYILDPNSFAAEFRGADAVKKFDAALSQASEGGGVLIIDHMDDFLKTAGSELASVLSSTLVKHLDRNPDFQAVIVSDETKDTSVLKSSTGISRMFQKVELQSEPDDAELRKIMIAKFGTLEKTHNVRFTGETADEIIRILNRYPGQSFEGSRPHNAITFADKVATYVHLNRYAEPVEVIEQREKIRLAQDELAITPPTEARAPELQKSIDGMLEQYAVMDETWKKKFEPLFKARASFDKLNTDIDQLRNQKDRSAADDKKLSTLAGVLGLAKGEVEKQEKALYPEPPLVAPKHAKVIFARESGMPIASLNEDKIEHLEKLDGYLDAEIAHQTEPKKALATAYFQRETGISDPSRPAGIFMFLGGTGLGKTELARVLSHFDMGESEEPIIIRLSEFKGKEAGKRLTGADPGLVGYEDGSCLEPVRKKSRAVILFDEADKGDPAVFDVMMQLLEEGKLTPSNSKVPIDFKDTIIIIASNALKASDFSKEELHDEAVIRERLKKVVNPDTGGLQWKPEFIGRLDRVFVFEDLEPHDHVQIFRKEVKKINRDFAPRGITVEIKDSTAEEIIKAYNDVTVGGRLSRNISKKYVRPLVTEFLKEHIREIMGENAHFKANTEIVLDGKTLKLLSGPDHPANAAKPQTTSTLSR